MLEVFILFFFCVALLSQTLCLSSFFVLHRIKTAFTHSYTCCSIDRFYDHDYAVTEHGTLNLTTNAAHTYFDGLDDATGKLVARTKNFKSAMLQGWNKVPNPDYDISLLLELLSVEVILAVVVQEERKSLKLFFDNF